MIDLTTPGAPYLSAVDARRPGATEEVGGWLVSARTAAGPLRLVDCSPVAKRLVQAGPAGSLAAVLAVPPGRAELFDDGVLVCATVPGEWLLLAASDPDPFVERLSASAGEPIAVVDLTHGRTLLRVTGAQAVPVLGTLTALDLSDAAFPHGAVAQAMVAGVRTAVVRDDLFAEEADLPLPEAAAEAPGSRPGPDPSHPVGVGPHGEHGDTEVRSYLLLAERSVGRYLYDRLVDAGRPHGLQEEGYAPYRARRADV